MLIQTMDLNLMLYTSGDVKIKKHFKEITHDDDVYDIEREEGFAFQTGLFGSGSDFTLPCKLSLKVPFFFAVEIYFLLFHSL